MSKVTLAPLVGAAAFVAGPALAQDAAAPAAEVAAATGRSC